MAEVVGQIAQCEIIVGPVSRLLFVVEVENTGSSRVILSPPVCQLVWNENEHGFYLRHIPFLAAGFIYDSMSLTLSSAQPNQPPQHWHVHFPVGSELLSAIEKMRDGKHVQLGVLLHSTGWEIDGTQFNPIQSWVLRKGNTSMGAVLPYRIARSDWEDMLQKLDYHAPVYGDGARQGAHSTESDNGPWAPRIFISHGHSPAWREVQAFLEKDLKLETLELAQEASKGRSVIQKLDEESSRCHFGLIVMTGDDVVEGEARARENVVHEIGFLQARYGITRVCLLHEEATSIPSNIAGLVYIGFPRGNVRSTFAELQRELRAAFSATPPAD